MYPLWLWEPRHPPPPPPPPPIPPVYSTNKMFVMWPYTADVLFFAGTYFRGQLIPNQFVGIQIRATSTGMRHIYFKYLNSRVLINRVDHVTAKTAKINIRRNILLLQYMISQLFILWSRTVKMSISAAWRCIDGPIDIQMVGWLYKWNKYGTRLI